MFFYAIIFVIYFYLVKYLISKGNKRKVIPMRNFPGPKPYPIIGNIFNFFTTDIQEMKRREVDAFKKYGETFRVKTLTNYIVATMDPKLCEKILGSTTNYVEKADDYKILKAVVGNGLVRSSGHQWRGHRKIIQPAFTAMNTIKGFIKIFDKKAKIFVELMRDHCDGTVFDIEKPVGRLTGDIIMETSMGLATNDQITHDCEYIHANTILKYICVKRITSYWKRFDILFSIFALHEKKLLDENMKIARDFTVNVIENRRKFLLQQNRTNNNEDEISKGMCFVDMLLQSTVDDQSLSDQDILDQMHTFMIAGQDTSSLTISAALFFLSQNKHIQDKVYDEIKDVYGSDKKSPITYQQICEMKYMDMVLKETMRLHPAIQIIGRNVDRDLELDDGRKIPAGVDIRLYLGQMMRNPKYFSNPNSFEPERFAAGKMNQFTYIPFSTGRRDCVGKKFAMFSMKTILTRVLQNYEMIEMGEEPIVQNELIARSINGFQMALKHRHDTKF